MDSFQYEFDSFYEFVTSFPVSIVGSVLGLFVLYLFFYLIKHFPKKEATLHIIVPFYFTILYLEGPVGVVLSAVIVFLVSHIPGVAKIRDYLRKRSFILISNTFLSKEIKVDWGFGYITYFDAILFVLALLLNLFGFMMFNEIS